jgi:hypothetical protein
VIKTSQRDTTTVQRGNNILTDTALREEAYLAAAGVFKGQGKVEEFARQLIDVCSRAKGKDFLIVHNPGGWGHARMHECLEWERGLVIGVTEVLRKLGYSYLVTQYFRSGRGWGEEIGDLMEQFRFFYSKANTLAVWLRFIVTHVANTKVILVGVSQGAAFGNAAMQRLDATYPVYSIELGFPFLYRSRRQNTERTLAIDTGGLKGDKFVNGTLLYAVGVLFAAPFKWLLYRIQGKKVLLSHCVRAPGHEYEWGNLLVGGKIKDFLEANFGR